MKKFIPHFLILTLIILGFLNFTEGAIAQTTPLPTAKPVTEEYKLLAPLPCPEGTNNCITSTYNTSDKNNLGNYLNMMIRLFIGICAVLAVIMIVIGGIEYMTSELMESKAHGKHRITGAVLGLLIALAAYALLYTINPDILQTDLDTLTQATINVDLGGESSLPFVPLSTGSLQALGINCPGSGGKPAVVSLGQQFIGKSTYSMTARNTITSSTVFVDCSSFVAQVYRCAGLASPGGNTASMFGSGATPANGATLDETQLHAGDLLGWTANPPKEAFGHVVIYMGNGQILDAQRNGAVQIRSLASIKDRITFAKFP